MYNCSKRFMGYTCVAKFTSSVISLMLLNNRSDLLFTLNMLVCVCMCVCVCVCVCVDSTTSL